MLKTTTLLNSLLATAATVTTVLVSASAMAVTFNVDRTFTNGINTASLTGTVDVPLGNYTLTEGDAAPFTDVNLTLNVNGDLFSLDSVSTAVIFGTGEFFINATASDLTFNTANADDENPAILGFYNSSVGEFIEPFYGLGTLSDGSGEQASTSSGVVLTPLSFPNVFGTVGTTSVPEPTATLALLGLGLLAIGTTKQKKV